MKKVLFPTDFSKNSIHALDFAAKYCQKLKAELILFHAMTVPVYATDGQMVSAEDIALDQEKLFQDKLTILAVETMKQYNIIVKTQTAFGFSAETIANEAKNMQADLIILAAKGETNFLNKLFGNVTEDLIDFAEVPLIALPENVVFEDIHKIAFASSNIDYDAVEIFDLIKLTASFNPQIKLVHIKKGNDYDKETFEDFPNLQYIEIFGDDKVNALLKYLDAENIDMVCVKKYKLPFLYRLFHESFTNDLFNKSPIPLMVFKDE
jgi:nucleotide-binding universal stress UspA family protein